jgi:aspartate aminotransferase-like enzyme
VLRLPEGLDADAFTNALLERGFRIARGLKPLGQGHVRIGHMGDLTLAHLDQLLDAMGTVLGDV